MKHPVAVSVRELSEILEHYFRAAPSLNYAVKIVGHPGVGKSAVVKQVAERLNRLFIDTRLAFKENVDLGGYPVPDPGSRRMIYFRPKFIPPEETPAGCDGIVWLLDEANRAHPTVIQTLFQIITERTCGEHTLPQNTAIVLAGNLGEDDSTTITEFDDAALDGRLAVLQLKPTAEDWLAWARNEGLHPSVIRYLSLFPERLWDEKNINPNPRGWHQVSLGVSESYGLRGEEELTDYLRSHPEGTLHALIESLVSKVAARDFILQVTVPRELTSADILAGNPEKLLAVRDGAVASEDLLWASAGVLSELRTLQLSRHGSLGDGDIRVLANVLAFLGSSRADLRMSFFYLLVRDCAIFTRVPEAIQAIPDEQLRGAVAARFARLLEEPAAPG